jgi:hypothetical protein
MSYDLKIAKKGDVLWVTATGKERTLEIVLAMARDILQACAEKKVTLVLLDICTLEGRLDKMDAYDLPDKHFANMRDRSVLTRLAIVVGEPKEDYSFFENVAVNRSYNLRIFSDSAKAAEWLKN